MLAAASASFITSFFSSSDTVDGNSLALNFTLSLEGSTFVISTSLVSDFASLSADWAISSSFDICVVYPNPHDPFFKTRTDPPKSDPERISWILPSFITIILLVLSLTLIST